MGCSWKAPELDNCFRTDKLWKEAISCGILSEIPSIGSYIDCLVPSWWNSGTVWEGGTLLKGLGHRGVGFNVSKVHIILTSPLSLAC